MRAVFGGGHTGPNATDRAKLGSKRHLICDGRGVPLAIQLTGANRNDFRGTNLLVRFRGRNAMPLAPSGTKPIQCSPDYLEPTLLYFELLGP